MSNPVFCLVAGIWYYHYFFFFILANSDKCVLLSPCGLNFFPLRDNSHTIRLTLLNCTVPWCVVYSHMINHHQNLFPKHFHPSEKKPSTHYPSLPVLPSSQPHKMLACGYFKHIEQNGPISINHEKPSICCALSCLK